MVAFSILNKGKVDGCVDRLAVALEKFGVNLSNFNDVKDIKGFC